MGIMKFNGRRIYVPYLKDNARTRRAERRAKVDFRTREFRLQAGKPRSIR